MKVLVFKDIKNKRWTIWNEFRTKHLGYARSLNLLNSVFIVDRKASRRIKSTGKRFPHAWIIGTKASSKGVNRNLREEVFYDLFSMSEFSRINGQTVKRAKYIHLTAAGRVMVSPRK